MAKPWLSSYPSDVVRTLAPYPEQSVYSVFEKTVGRFPERPALSFFGKEITYLELAAEVDQLARALASMGVAKGDRAALLLPNCPQYVVGFYALQRLGAIPVGTNPLYTERELAHQLSDAGCKVVIVLDQLFRKLEAVRSKARVETVIVAKVTDYMPFPLNVLAPIRFKKEAKHEGRPWPPVPAGADAKSWTEVMQGTYPPAPSPAVDPKEDVAALVYTGGTTGLSKGAMLTHFNLVANVHQASSWFPDLVEGEEVFLCVLPFFHSYGLQVGLHLCMLLGGKLVLMPRFDLKRAVKAIAKEKATVFPGVPRIYQAINDSPESQRHDLSSIKACISGAAPLPLSTSEKFERLTGGSLVEGYGLTECSPVTHANPINGKRKVGSIGLPLPDTDCRLVDIDDRSKEVSTGEIGELAIAGPQIMKGYWNRPDETAGMIGEGAGGVRWLYTGDIVRMDEEGYFFIVDRKKDMIIVSGFNVYPTEVEEVLSGHPKIQKVAVVGIPDERTGEAVKAFVVLRQGERATAEEIIEWSRDEHQGLTGYRVPSSVEFRDALPETIIGKVLRRVLLEEEKKKIKSST